MVRKRKGDAVTQKLSYTQRLFCQEGNNALNVTKFAVLAVAPVLNR